MGDDADDDLILLDPLDDRPDDERPAVTFGHRLLQGRLFLIQGEEESEYNLLLAELAFEFPIVDLETSILVERLGQQIWLLRRYVRWEMNFYSKFSAQLAFHKYLRESLTYRERAEAGSLRTIKELQRLSKARARRAHGKEPRPQKTPEAVLFENSGKIEQPGAWKWQQLAEYLRDNEGWTCDPDDEKVFRKLLR